MARGLKFRIKVVEALYYPFSENKDSSCFFINNTKTDTVRKLIQPQACSLGTDCILICTFYYLLYGIEISAIIHFLMQRSYCSSSKNKIFDWLLKLHIET